MGKKPGALMLRFDKRPVLEALTDAQRGKLLMAMLDYAETGKTPENFSQALFVAFESMRSCIDADISHYESVCSARKEAGKKGGRPRKSQSEESKENQTKPNGFFEKQKNPNSNTNSNSNTKVVVTPPPDTAAALSPTEFWKMHFGEPSANTLAKIQEAQQSVDDATICQAMQVALDNDKSTWAYVAGVLKHWEAKKETNKKLAEAMNRPRRLKRRD